MIYIHYFIYLLYWYPAFLPIEVSTSSLSEDPGRVIHYSGGKLVAFGSVNRKIHFLDVNEVKEVHPVLIGHAGRIHAIYLNEQKGFLLSGSYDLSIR